jgi:hypothetical protein
VREGVAMALQRIGRESMQHLVAEMQVWSGGDPFEQRAAAAGLAEPELLREPSNAVEVLAILDRITTSVAATEDRRHEGFRVLRQAMGYCWSVAAAAAPDNARAYFEKWLRSSDKDVAWIMKSNLDKARMDVLRKQLARSMPPPKATAKAKPKPRVKPAVKPKAKAKPRLKPAAKPKAKVKPKPSAKPKPKTKPRSKAAAVKRRRT